jgi:hypothetical protein
MEFWRGEAYQKFFDHLESKGGFYYEVSFSEVVKTQSDDIYFSDGETRRFIALLRHSLHQKTKSTSSVISVTAMTLSNIAHRGRTGRKDGVLAIPKTVSVSSTLDSMPRPAHNFSARLCP